MEFIRGLHNIRDPHRGCVLTIGKFDGVHLGHEAVIGQLLAKSQELQLPSVVMLFEPQPEELFTPDKAPARLSRLRDKYHRLQQLGVDRLLCLNFTPMFAAQSAEYFVQHLLVEQLGIAFLVVGDDFRFGKGRKGDFEYLQQAGKQHNFEVINTASLCLNQARVSSSAIRELLVQDQLQEAAAMLGRPFSISGKVVHGAKKGRTIGFPTANLLLKRHRSPVQGVYAVTVHIGEQQFLGVANVGNRPTVDGEKPQLEVHIFDFDQHLYGQFIEVDLHHKIRQERKFASFEELKLQIQRDAKQAREWLQNNR
ncbi:bifunctional riboflavin kinase/FAD synthetase [Planctobacterium marinum]|uniref:Riboflavin biosynthesis protein n=1 Tax=Planctobacterium marinum TaxID=1631968 RepID=A0AA48HLE7_9ALTE|nr:riboflavin biosynthesis protein [Planctobacterium marinum]